MFPTDILKRQPPCFHLCLNNMLSKAKIKYLRSLDQKKVRNREGVFLAEGSKLVSDLLTVASPLFLAATEKWLSEQAALPACECITALPDELQRASALTHAQEVMAVFPQFNTNLDITRLSNTFCIVLDGIQDPGNLGTIIRIADWFGVDTVICSTDTADLYNPKVVQATMGSIARVPVVYTDLPQLFSSLPTDIPIYGTFLDAPNLYETSLTPHGLLVMGNEGKGISPSLVPLISQRLFIPPYPGSHPTAESLNVAIATAVACAEFRRRC